MSRRSETLLRWLNAVTPDMQDNLLSPQQISGAHTYPFETLHDLHRIGVDGD